MKIKTAPEGLFERMALLLNLAPIPLVDTQVAFNAARAIMAGAELGIYESIGKGKKRAEQIAAECKTDPKATKQLIDCLVGLSYLNYKDGSYSIRKKLHKWLLKEYPSNLIGKLRFQIYEWNWMANLEEFVRTGKPLDFHYKMNATEWASYQDGMRDLSINSAKELGKKLKLRSGASQMLDIGGSHGLYSIEICKRNPGLSSTILELPGAIDQASKIAAAHGLTDRIHYQAGNALTDELGENKYDLIMINNVVHHFTNDQNIELAKKVSRALKPGGLYAIGEFIRQNKPGEGGAVAATAGLYFALISSSGTWSTEEMRSWMDLAGLKPERSVSLMSLPGWRMTVGKK